MTLSIYDWIKQIPSSVLEHNSIPLMGYPPSFPWEEFAQAIKKLFNLSEFSIHSSMVWEWRSNEELTKGIGSKVHTLHFTLSPSGGSFYWSMSEGDLQVLLQNFIGESRETIQNLNSEYLDGFIQFLALEILHLIPSLDYDPSLSFQIVNFSSFPKSTCLTLDIEIKAFSRSFWGRLLFSPQFNEQWKERYSDRTLDSILAYKLDLPLHLEAGYVEMTQQEWSKLRPGDFVFLDSCTLDVEGEGELLLTTEGVPLFRGKVQNGNIKILDFPTYREVRAPMNAKHIDSEDEDEELYEEEYDEDLGEENDLSLFDNEEESEYNEDEESEYNEDEELEFEEEDLSAFEEDEENMLKEALEEEVSEEQLEKWPPLPELPTRSERKKKKKEISEKHIQAEVSHDESNFSIRDLPLTIVVEVGRLQMPFQKIADLQPGNLLELNMHPENGVDLVINGKRIGKGELILIGEALGVRILDIG